MGNRDRSPCFRCGPVIETTDKGISIFMFCQTFGLKPRRKQAAPTICYCRTCVMVISVHPGFEEWDCFNFAAHKMISELVGAFRPETREAIGRMFELVLEREGKISDAEIIACLPEPEILPPPRRLKEAV